MQYKGALPPDMPKYYEMAIFFISYKIDIKNVTKAIQTYIHTIDEFDEIYKYYLDHFSMQGKESLIIDASECIL